MTRFSYEPGAFEELVPAPAEDGDAPEFVNVYVEGFCIFDAQRGRTDGTEIAFCKDRADAERIVVALNAVSVVADITDTGDSL